MCHYERLISEIDPTVDADMVERWMRHKYRTLNHLRREVFEREIKLYKKARA